MHICGFYLLIAFGYKTSNQSNLQTERKNIGSQKKVQQYISVLQWQFNMHDQYEAELPSFL